MADKKPTVTFGKKIYDLDTDKKFYIQRSTIFRDILPAPAILCAECMNSKFEISYGKWECMAHCDCGNSFIIYDG